MQKKVNAYCQANLQSNEEDGPVVKVNPCFEISIYIDLSSEWENAIYNILSNGEMAKLRELDDIPDTKVLPR